ncbi:hypothetical protein ONA91_04080 [Micromonospora sp. DR5-3]|uniref:hypothetical protein n=1 Tax=unclassified Micromonospora TaxID=2617518 RepID=UPI0011D3DB34|nr:MULTISPECIES: hypothetical protein [unclassified Micromonospora]MCW3813636.1 hypothetical protein [Micromonospora sp. DR5-3]TYC25665.1 hypothetical protein FXF52_04400 [Micromonospora sp. MP36]
MTYQQLFDDLIGEAPLNTVDVDRVIGRERRARRLRIGAGTTAVAAAVAAVVFGTTTLIGKPHAQPARPKPTITTVPGTNQDLDRIDAAVVAALTREEPRLTWATKGAPASKTPIWESRPGGGTTLASGYLGNGSLRIDGIDVSVRMEITRNGAPAWETVERRPCSKFAVECGERTGPHGEKIKFDRSVREQEVPPRLRDRMSSRAESASVVVLRSDGSLMSMFAGTTGEDSRLPLTVEQLTAVALDPAIVLAPLPPASPTPSSTVTTVAGTEADATRLDTALTAALRRQAAGFTWMTKWGGTDSPTPVGFAPKGRLNVDAPVLDAATFRVGDRAGQLTLRLVREGRPAWESAPPCPTAGLAGRNCAVTEGPAGERIRARQLLGDFGRRGDLHRPALSGNLLVEVLRPDGTLAYLSLTQDKPALSLAQLIEVGRDPALTLAPPPPAGAGTAQAVGPPNDAYEGAQTTAASAALEAVSPDGTIFLRTFSAGSDGLTGTRQASFVFLVQRAGLAGDGEIVVQRRLGVTVSCETVRSISSQFHERHPHGGECTESTGSDGNRVVAIVARSSGTVSYDVFVQRPDRGTVEVVLDNRPNTGATTDMPEGGDLQYVWPKGVQGGGGPPLTLDQVTELAGHPDLLNLLP